MTLFREYMRKQKAQLREVTDLEIETGKLLAKGTVVSLSEEDKKNGSPKKGDMVARNPKNHNDQWLVSKEYFEDNFEELPRFAGD